MLEAIWDSVRTVLGIDADDLSFIQMAARALLVYLAGLVMVRLGEKRFLGKSTAFDVLLGIILGSVVSRAINGSAAFFPTLVAGFLLVGLHWLFAVIAFRSDRFGNLFKGHTRTLIREGEIQWDAMSKSHISRNDLLGALRANGNIEDPEQVKVARLERSGEISVIQRKQPPRVVEVAVRDGVQTIRIEVS